MSVVRGLLWWLCQRTLGRFYCYVIAREHSVNRTTTPSERRWVEVCRMCGHATGGGYE